MPRSWPSLRLWRRIAISGVVTLIAILIVLRLFAMSPLARSLLEARLEAMTIRGQTIELDGLEGDLLGQLRVDRLRLRDSDGVWLDANDIALDWSPLAYVSQHLKIRDVSAARMTLMRRPIIASSTSQGGGVQRFTLDALSVPVLSVEDGVAGPAQTLALNGHVQTLRRKGRLEINLVPQSESGDRITGALAWGGTVPLRGDVAISGAPSGLIASLVQAPEGVPVSANLTAEGALSDWRFKASGRVGSETAFDLDLTRDGEAYQSQGQVTLDTLGLFAPLKARLGSQVRFGGTLDPARKMSAMLEAETLTAQASGELNALPTTVLIENLSAQISRADAPALAGLARLNLPEFSLDGTLNLALQEQIFEGKIAAPRLTYGNYSGFEIATNGSIRLSDVSLDIATTATARQLTGLPDDIAALVAGPATADVMARYNRDTRTLQISESAFQTPNLQTTLQGTLDMKGPVAIAGALRTPALPVLADLDGSWSLTGPNTDALHLKFEGQIDAARDSEIVYALVGDNAEIKLSLIRDAQLLSLDSATLTSDTLTATASGQLENGRLTGRSRVEAAALSVPSASLEQVVADLTISGEAAAPSLQLTADIGALQAAGQRLTELEMSSNTRIGGDSAFAVAASAIYQDETLELDLAGRRSSDAIIIDRLQSSWQDLTADGTGQMVIQTPSTSQFDISIAGRVADLGEVDADITYQDTILAGHIRLQETALGPLAFEQANATLSGRWPRFTGELTYEADFETPGGAQSLTGAHGVHADLIAQTFELDGAAVLASQTLAFVSPLVVNLESGLQASGQIMGFGGQIDLNLEPLQTGQSTIRVANVSVQKLGPMLDRQSLMGDLDIDLSLGLIEGELAGTARGSISDLTRGVSDAAASNLILAAVVESNRLSATLQTEDADQNFNFTARASTSLQHSGSLLSIRPVPSAPIPVSISGEGAIEPLWAIAAPPSLRIAGQARVDIDNGTGETWRFQGPVQVENGVFEDGITGLHLNDMQIDAALRPDGIDILAARVAGRRSGYAEASGSYKFDGSGSVTATLTRLNAFNRSDVSATLSGTADIDRRNRSTSISGDLRVDQARINLEKLPRAGYTTLDVVFADQIDETGDTAPVREAIALNLDISADRRIFVAGSDVDTEWGLTARVTGALGRPNITGRANLIRGDADLLSRKFRFSEGQVRFVGDPRDSQLLIRADRTSDEVTSTITLSGSLTDLEIGLSSDPSLPNDEILSRVLFGRSPSELSPLQAAQLAGAAAQLAGGDAFNLVGQLQEATGLDRLDIGLDDQGAASLSTGKYLSEDIYLEIESGVTGAPGVALEWTPLENVAVDAEIDPELGPKVAIQWKRDFDRLPGESAPK